MFCRMHGEPPAWDRPRGVTGACELPKKSFLRLPLSVSCRSEMQHPWSVVYHAEYDEDIWVTGDWSCPKVTSQARAGLAGPNNEAGLIRRSWSFLSLPDLGPRTAEIGPRKYIVQRQFSLHTQYSSRRPTNNQLEKP